MPRARIPRNRQEFLKDVKSSQEQPKAKSSQEQPRAQKSNSVNKDNFPEGNFLMMAISLRAISLRAVFLKPMLLGQFSYEGNFP